VVAVRPVDQTTFGYPHGNCFSACVASLLHLAVDDVPWFLRHADWYGAFAEWLRPRGFYPVNVPWSGAWCPEGYYILGGRSPRHAHAVVARGPDIVHDPHPSRAGLVAREDCTMLVPLDPALGRWRE
jgi:hypothetical protein